MTKVISISDEAYDYLKSIKDEKESFSKIIKKLVPKSDKRDILKLAGSLKDESFIKAMNNITKSRENIRFRTARFD